MFTKEKVEIERFILAPHKNQMVGPWSGCIVGASLYLLFSVYVHVLSPYCLGLNALSIGCIDNCLSSLFYCICIINCIMHCRIGAVQGSEPPFFSENFVKITKIIPNWQFFLPYHPLFYQNTPFFNCLDLCMFRASAVTVFIHTYST